MKRDIINILKQNFARQNKIHEKFNPITGFGSIGKRFHGTIEDYPLKEQWLPVELKKYYFTSNVLKCGSVCAYITDVLQQECTEDNYQLVCDMLVRERIQEDVAFWFAYMVHIKNKGGGGNVLFRLNRAQRRLIAWYESRRKAGKPIRLILLKARQWGGSTATQMYMAWLQLVKGIGLNSLIVAQVNSTSDEIRDMFDTMLKEYPQQYLYPIGEEGDKKVTENVGNARNIMRVIPRKCKIKTGSAERPDSARGGDYNLVHCSEVGIWTKTDGKSPEDIVRSATSGILYRPMTMIVYESTANGTGNFFHREYLAATKGESQFEPMFVPWYEIEQYSIPFDSDNAKEEFALWLWQNKDNQNIDSDRAEPGYYYWKLWQMGATLEALQWYREERKKYHDHGDIASEFPSDHIEAFKHSGQRVFNQYMIEQFRPACHQPMFVGDVYGDALYGRQALDNLRFTEDNLGQLWVWHKPETYTDMRVLRRYLVVVDIGGSGQHSDWSVICVFDRYWMMEGDKPEVVAQWYGHTDMDILAWKAAQIAKWYDNALLVIESNTLETKDKDRDVEGDQSGFILNQIKDSYDNLYARPRSEDDIKEGRPAKYGFHTNTQTKPQIITFLKTAIREKLYVEHDDRCLDEFTDYERKQNGAYGAIQGKHDDLLMTRAIGLHICYNKMDLPVIEDVVHNVSHKKRNINAATIG